MAKLPKIGNSLPRISLDEILPFPQVRTTYLPPDREAAYRAWLTKIGQTPGSGYAVDKNWNGTDYDLRGFYSKYGPVNISKGQHFTDEFKLPNHSSFSNESVYSAGNAAPFAGSWSDGNLYTPSATQYTRGKRPFRDND